MGFYKTNNSNISTIEVNELPNKKHVGTLYLEQAIKYPGDILVINGKNYITVEKVHHYYFDGFQYQFTKTCLYVRALESFC